MASSKQRGLIAVRHVKANLSKIPGGARRRRPVVEEAASGQEAPVEFSSACVASGMFQVGTMGGSQEQGIADRESMRIWDAYVVLHGQAAAAEGANDVVGNACVIGLSESWLRWNTI